jgi:hypothetical protein
MEQVAALVAAPGLAQLEELVAREQARRSARLTAQWLEGGEMTVLQRQADFDRGFIQGMKFPGDKVREAAARLRRVERREATIEEQVDEWSSYEQQTA